MTYFMSDDVCISEITVGSQLFLHLCKEGQVDVYALVGRTIEWPHGRTGTTTARLHATGKQYQAGRLISFAHFLEFFSPYIFCPCQNLAGELG